MRVYSCTYYKIFLLQRNPNVPAIHFNYRYFEVVDEKGKVHWWFGGGTDLTPMYLDEKVSVWFRACPTAHARILWDEFINLTLYLHFRIHITVIFHIKIWWYYKYKATICIQEDEYGRIEDLQRILLLFIRMPSIFIKHLKKHVTNTTKNSIQSLRSGAMNTSIFLIEVC